MIIHSDITGNLARRNVDGKKGNQQNNRHTYAQAFTKPTRTRMESTKNDERAVLTQNCKQSSNASNVDSFFYLMSNKFRREVTSNIQEKTPTNEQLTVFEHAQIYATRHVLFTYESRMRHAMSDDTNVVGQPTAKGPT